VKKEMDGKQIKGKNPEELKNLENRVWISWESQLLEICAQEEGHSLAL
jgi:hypothetical protein